MNALSLIGAAAAGLVGGAIFMVGVVFVGIKLNLKGLRTACAGWRQDAGFYRAWAITGAALGASWLTAIQVLDAAGIKDPWYGLTMVAIGLIVFLPMIGYLKRHRSGSR
jgi:hypothetical protein